MFQLGEHSFCAKALRKVHVTCPHRKARLSKGRILRNNAVLCFQVFRIASSHTSHRTHAILARRSDSNQVFWVDG